MECIFFIWDCFVVVYLFDFMFFIEEEFVFVDVEMVFGIVYGVSYEFFGELFVDLLLMCVMLDFDYFCFMEFYIELLMIWLC